MLLFFARKLCDIVFLRAAGALKKVHENFFFLIFSLAEFFFFNTKKRFASIPVA